MSKKTETVQKDYTQFSYTEDAQVIIPGGVFTTMLNLISHLADDERKTFWPAKNTPAELFSDDNTPITYYTEKGMAVSNLLAELLVVHQMNTDSGVATSVEELSKPKLEIVK